MLSPKLPVTVGVPEIVIVLAVASGVTVTPSGGVVELAVPVHVRVVEEASPPQA